MDLSPARRRGRFGTLAAVSACLVAGLAAIPSSGATSPAASPRTCASPVHLSSWSLSRLAAQLVVVPVQAGDVGALAPLTRTGFGGILLFGSTAPKSLGTTVRRLESASPQQLGVLVMTDEEGGGVRRLDNLVGAFPWARTMARTMPPSTITSVARRVGAQLLAAGVNTDLAPVLDVDGRDAPPDASDPDGWRSFGGSVPVVITDGGAFAAGLRAAHVLAVVKHFPGLGGSTGNTDFGPAATLPWAVLKASALHTFESAIARGAPAVMVANAHVPGLTPLPATLSSKVMVDVLRRWLRFKGLVMTDSLTAGAIAATHLSVPAAAAAAIAAGADSVLLGAQPSTARDVALAVSVSAAIAAGVGRGQYTRATLEAAVTHVLAAKGDAGCLAS